jgi:hypothetical protein
MWGFIIPPFNNKGVHKNVINYNYFLIKKGGVFIDPKQAMQPF